MFDPSVFFPAFKAAGMLCVATDGDGDFDVDYRRPGRVLASGAISNEHEIEYQSADRVLAEGDALSLVDPSGDALGNFKVRGAPFIPELGNAADGTFYCALLTKV